MISGMLTSLKGISLIEKRSAKMYSSIREMSIYNWWSLRQSGDYRYLLLKYEEKAEITDEYHERWIKLYQEYLDLYGIGDEQQEILSKIAYLIGLQSDLIINNKRFLLNEIKIVEGQIKELTEPKTKQQSLDGVFVHINKFMGYRCNPKDMSVVEFKEVLTQIELSNEQSN